MRKNTKKRLVSLVCILCMLCTTCFNGGSVIAEAGMNEDITLDTAPEKEFATWTFSDVGIKGQTVKSNSLWETNHTNGKFLDKTIFKGTVKFDATGGNFGNFYIGGVDSSTGSKWRGFVFIANGSTDKITFGYVGPGGTSYNAEGNTGKEV